MSKDGAKRIPGKGALQQIKGLCPMKPEVRRGSQVDKHLDWEQGFEVHCKGFNSSVKHLGGSAAAGRVLGGKNLEEKAKVWAYSQKILGGKKRSK